MLTVEEMHLRRPLAMAFAVAVTMSGTRVKADEIAPFYETHARLGASLEAIGRPAEALKVYLFLGESIVVPIERRVEFRIQANRLAAAIGDPYRLVRARRQTRRGDRPIPADCTRPGSSGGRRSWTGSVFCASRQGQP
jgi:hypothetical protein